MTSTTISTNAPHRFSSSPIAVDNSTPIPIAQATAIVLAYNQETLIEEAVHAILSQTILPAELILSDDCSTDNTHAIFLKIARTYSGPVSIKVRRNTTNLRFAGHINAAVAQASHDWIFPHAGDDTVLPERMAIFLKAQAQHPTSAFFWSDVWVMNWQGEVDPTHRSPITRQIMSHFGAGPSQLWHRALFLNLAPSSTLF